MPINSKDLPKWKKELDKQATLDSIVGNLAGKKFGDLSTKDKESLLYAVALHLGILVE